MTTRRRTRTLWSTWLLAVGLGAAPGCLSCCHPVASPPKEQTEACRALAQPNRKCVYVFLLNGTDALGCANLAGVQKYLFDLGFTKTYYGEACNNAYFRDEIRRISKEQPDARFVLVGYDIGAKAACNVAKWVNGDGVHFDLIVYIDPVMLDDDASCRPENCGEAIDIVSSHGTALAALETVSVPDAGHYAVVTHSATLCLLANQLIQIAGEAAPLPPPEAVPVLDPSPPPMPPAEETAPTPRPVQPPQTSGRGEWDFLKPTDKLQVVPTQLATTPAAQGGDWHTATAPYPIQWGRYPVTTAEPPTSH